VYSQNWNQPLRLRSFVQYLIGSCIVHFSGETLSDLYISTTATYKRVDRFGITVTSSYCYSITEPLQDRYD